MTDTDKELVARLRESQEAWGKLTKHASEMGFVEAADALERLSAEVERLKSALTKLSTFDHSTEEKIAIARSALRGEE